MPEVPHLWFPTPTVLQVVASSLKRVRPWRGSPELQQDAETEWGAVQQPQYQQQAQQWGSAANPLAGPNLVEEPPAAAAAAAPAAALGTTEELWMILFEKPSGGWPGGGGMEGLHSTGDAVGEWSVAVALAEKPSWRVAGGWLAAVEGMWLQRLVGSCTGHAVAFSSCNGSRIAPTTMAAAPLLAPTAPANPAAVPSQPCLCWMRADWVDYRGRKASGQINAKFPDFKKKPGGSEHLPPGWPCVLPVYWVGSVTCGIT